MDKEVYRYKVLVVDDEPMAVKAICKIIERNCPSFKLIGEALNGQEALDKIEETLPDVVLTDIEMPVMNGLAMARAAKEKKPDLCFVVISGYQDYEYMREAIQSGVLDYLAKPIVPSAITVMMERVRIKLALQFYERRNEILREFCRGRQPEMPVVEKYFPYKRFYAALIRENGLPRRFSRTREPEIFGTAQEAYCVYGRDSMEQLFLIPAALLGEKNIEDYMENTIRRQRREQSYVTLLYYGMSFPAEKITERIGGLYHKLNMYSTVGLNQSINLDLILKEDNSKTGSRKENTQNLSGGNGASAPYPWEETDIHEVDMLLAELERYRKTKQYDKLKTRISIAYDEWEKQQRPQFWLEQASRRLLHFLRKEGGNDTSLLDFEYSLEEAFFHAADMKTLRENLDSLFFSFEREQKEKPKVDSPAFFEAIEVYLQDHLADPLSLQSLSEQFAISQAYMSKLFRKYADQSYAQYLTQLRMEQAKTWMKENPNLFIKDIAPMVGFRDQFYFSRIFRAYTGKSPADYLKEEGKQ